ncbi:FxsA family protein [Amorphus coralli]|uniref:FxsA family protein n=1 Tax=Amorphus coralli TaxID=340680 RepID=UPI0003702D11|nr:FxsA family protein [Amorphus coralli]
MPLGLILFLSLLAIPALEIAVFILVGSQIGVLPTIGMVFLTAVIGSMLLRHQGLSILNRVRTEMDAGRVPGAELGHGAMILAAGVLLLTPGFVTDTIGFLLFVPPVRETIWNRIRGRIAVTVARPGGATTGGPAGGGAAGPRGRGPVVDLDANDYGPADPNSPWSDGRPGSRLSDPDSPRRDA